MNHLLVSINKQNNLKQNASSYIVFIRRRESTRSSWGQNGKTITKTIQYYIIRCVARYRRGKTILWNIAWLRWVHHTIIILCEVYVKQCKNITPAAVHGLQNASPVFRSTISWKAVSDNIWKFKLTSKYRKNRFLRRNRIDLTAVPATI